MRKAKRVKVVVPYKDKGFVEESCWQFDPGIAFLEDERKAKARPKWWAATHVRTGCSIGIKALGLKEADTLSAELTGMADWENMTLDEIKADAKLAKELHLLRDIINLQCLGII